MRPLLPALLLLVSLVPAQGPRGPVRKPDPDTRWRREWRDLSRLVVKFREGLTVRLRAGRWAGAAGLEGANALLGREVMVHRLFHRDEADLDRERAELLAGLPEGMEPPADLNNYYGIQVESEARGLALLRALNDLEAVEIAFPEHRSSFPCEPGDIPPATPDYTSKQNYRDPAPTGIGQAVARRIAGGRGSALQVIDIESSWRLNHEDIPQLTAKAVIGAHTESLNPNHGVAVVGEIAAEWDRHGVSGITDRVAVKVHSHMRRYWASSVNTAAANTPKGGFIVLEVQLSYNGKISPMESRQDVFDAVRNAVMAGKHVIAAAGNGSNDLDGAIYGGLFDRTKRDSGSIIVGATNGSALTRASFSNHGTCVDANGWGYTVTTTGYGYLFNPGGDVRQQYTDRFSGTSSATPIVTGAAIALAGAVLEQTGSGLTPTALRDLIRRHGTDVPAGRIGKRPDLEKLLAAVGLPDGLELTAEGGLGGTLRASLTGTGGAGYLLLISMGRGRLEFGTGGAFLLDLATAYVVEGGVLPGTGKRDLALPVPNSALFSRRNVYLQGVLIEGAKVRLTTSICNFIL